MSAENEALNMKANTLLEKAENKEAIHKQEVKQARKKGFKRGVVISGAGAAILILFLL